MPSGGSRVGGRGKRAVGRSAIALSPAPVPSATRTSVPPMDRDWLAGRLEAGDSIEAIAREVGRHPSTVAYWVNRHGLVSQYAPRHASRGAFHARSSST